MSEAAANRKLAQMGYTSTPDGGGGYDIYSRQDGDKVGRVYSLAALHSWQPPGEGQTALSILTAEEYDILTRAEAVIERGQQTFLEVGEALQEIRDGHLYRADYDTFDQYCRLRWGFGSKRAYQLIDAAEVTRALSTQVDTPPQNEKEARAIKRAAPEDRADLLRQADEQAGPAGRTAAQLERMVKSALTPAQAEPDQATLLEVAQAPQPLSAKHAYEVKAQADLILLSEARRSIAQGDYTHARVLLSGVQVSHLERDQILAACLTPAQAAAQAFVVEQRARLTKMNQTARGNQGHLVEALDHIEALLGERAPAL